MVYYNVCYWTLSCNGSHCAHSNVKFGGQQLSEANTHCQLHLLASSTAMTKQRTKGATTDYKPSHYATYFGVQRAYQSRRKMGSSLYSPVLYLISESHDNYSYISYHGGMDAGSSDIFASLLSRSAAIRPI